MVAIAEAARSLGLALHLDGARLWNAHVATGLPLADARRALRHRLGLSLEGPRRAGRLGAQRPPQALITRARRRRKMLGGGMRQAGILAAAGRYALAHHIPRLAEDHANARAFAESIANTRGLVVDLASVETNLCIFALDEALPCDAASFVERAKRKGLLLNEIGGRRLRVVTHLDVDRAACLRAAEIVGELVAEAG